MAHIPETLFAETVTLSWRAAELKDGMDDVRVNLQQLMQTLYKEGVAIAEYGHRQRTHPQPAIIAPAHENGF